MAPAKSIEKGRLFCDIFQHGITGLGAWKELADAMVAAVSHHWRFFVCYTLRLTSH